jgi:Sec-independent protein translocase protein TatA
MLDGLFQPMYLLIIFFIALLIFGSNSCRSWKG